MVQFSEMRKKSAANSRRTKKRRRKAVPAAPAFDGGSLCDLAVEVWRLSKKIRSGSISLAENDMKFIDRSLDRFSEFLLKNGVEILDPAGERYNAGSNLEVIAWEENGGGTPMVRETLEPTILVRGRICRKAKVIVHG